MGKVFTQKRKDISWLRRGIDKDVKLMLGIKSAGRCEFNGCNKFLFRHPVTGLTGNFAELAHIIAFSSSGPRAKTHPRPKEINGISNLMLLCPVCHKLIDTRIDLYPVEILRTNKKLHEKRVFRLTGLSGTNVTTVIKVVARIRGQDVNISDSDVDESLYPRFCEKESICNIDLKTHGDLTHGNMQGAAKSISDNIQRFNGLSYSGCGVGHVSVFALAPISLLVYLGSNLSTKVTTDMYQRHRDTESWKWKTRGKPLQYSTYLKQRGKDKSKVALVVSVSGQVSLDSLPKSIGVAYSIYEIKVGLPRTDILGTREDLELFRREYEVWQGQMMQKHDGKVKKIELFSAVPAPIAIMLGWARLPQVSPALRVYEHVNGKFKIGLEVN
ncbi:MAG: SAVED domain-containing protein [Candidatus Omnitrophica bacterium]|nr:SAVED domain-containing protein [Candidatus Omnitrophota bacterium]